MSFCLKILFISLFGALGASARHLVIEVISHYRKESEKESHFPHHTLFVNLLACLLVGYFFPLMKYKEISSFWRETVLFGLLAAFSTFSSFITDLFEHFQREKKGHGLLYTLLTITFGIGLAFLGRFIFFKVVR